MLIAQLRFDLISTCHPMRHSALIVPAAKLILSGGF